MDWTYLFSTLKYDKTDRRFGKVNNCTPQCLTFHSWRQCSGKFKEQNVKLMKLTSSVFGFVFSIVIVKQQTCGPLTGSTVESLHLPSIPFPNNLTIKLYHTLHFPNRTHISQSLNPVVIQSKLCWILTHDLPAFLIYVLPDSRPLRIQFQS